MKRVVIILLVLAVVIGVTVAGYQLLNPKPYSIADDPDVEVIDIQRDTIVSTINATGRIEPEGEVQLEFEAGNSIVADVLVDRGQYVTAGMVLARLESSQLELAVKQAVADLTRAEAQLEQLYEPALAEDVASARAAVVSAQANLDHVLAGPRPDEIESAQAAVASAQANLDKVLDGLSEDDITVAAANLRRAEIALQDAQWAYDQVAFRGDIGSLPQSAQLEQATIDYETALANYNLAVRGATEADIAAARSQLAQAESNLARLLESPTEADVEAARSQLAQAEANLARLLKEPNGAEVAAAQAAVDVAQIGLEQAELNLEKASLVSPIDGVVNEVNVKRGEQPPIGQAAMTITDASAFHIDVEVDEIDIGRVAPDQSVIVAVDAIPDEDFTGHVAEVSPGPMQGASSGIVAYEVTINLDSDDPRLRTGMTSDATIETERMEGVLVVPNRAVSVDRSGGEPVAYVEKVGEDGNPARTEVELGLRNETLSQVLSGLEVGDQIVIRGRSRRDQLQQIFQGE
jgi:HlyD family secretion protein